MPNALDVLHVYSGNLFGGVERMLISIANLDAASCHPTFALCFEGKLSRALRANRAQLELLAPVRLRNPLSVLRARTALARVLASRHFDAVICHSIWTYCIFASVVRRAGHPPVLFLHDIPNPRGALYRWAWRSPPALCIANSVATARPLQSMRARVPVRVVHPLVAPPTVPPTEAARGLRSELGATSDSVVILQASRFDSWKGHKNLLAALSQLRDVPNWQCWIAGAPQRLEEEAYRRELFALVSANGLAERVRFLGHRDDMDLVLASSDIYCQPNETPEPFGMVFVEAMYAAKPVVGRALGGALEIVTPECGVLCEAGVAPLADALRSLIEDRALRERLARGGPSRAEALCGPRPFTAAFGSALAELRNRSGAAR